MNEIGGYLSTFLQFGNLDPFLADMEPEINISGIDRILRIHFALRKDVLEFVRQLPDRVKRLKSRVDMSPEESKNMIRGKIDWNRTIKARYSENPEDSSHYVITRIERSFHTRENEVLKALLSDLHSIVFNELRPVMDSGHPWVSQWIEDRGLGSIITETYFRNPYLRQVPELKGSMVKERTILDTRKSRIPLYREAATLLLSYRKIMHHDLDPAEAMELLRSTFIRPEKTETLFQLYWIFRLIRTMTAGLDRDELTFHPIEGEDNLIAGWEARSSVFKLYYGSTGDLDFSEKVAHIPMEDLGDGFLRRELEVLRHSSTLCLECFGIRDSTGTIWSGTPDILVEETSAIDGSLRRIHVAMVKYSNSRSVKMQGLRELMESMALVKRDGTYLVRDPSDLFGADSVRGWLFTDRTDHGVIEHGNIRVVPYGNDIPPF